MHKLFTVILLFSQLFATEPTDKVYSFYFMLKSKYEDLPVVHNNIRRNFMEISGTFVHRDYNYRVAVYVAPKCVIEEHFNSYYPNSEYDDKIRVRFKKFMDSYQQLTTDTHEIYIPIILNSDNCQTNVFVRQFSSHLKHVLKHMNIIQNNIKIMESSISDAKYSENIKDLEMNFTKAEYLAVTEYTKLNNYYKDNTNFFGFSKQTKDIEIHTRISLFIGVFYLASKAFIPPLTKSLFDQVTVSVTAIGRLNVFNMLRDFVGINPIDFINRQNDSQIKIELLKILAISNDYTPESHNFTIPSRNELYFLMYLFSTDQKASDTKLYGLDWTVIYMAFEIYPILKNNKTLNPYYQKSIEFLSNVNKQN